MASKQAPLWTLSVPLAAFMAIGLGAVNQHMEAKAEQVTPRHERAVSFLAEPDLTPCGDDWICVHQQMTAAGYRLVGKPGRYVR